MSGSTAALRTELPPTSSCFSQRSWFSLADRPVGVGLNLALTHGASHEPPSVNDAILRPSAKEKKKKVYCSGQPRGCGGVSHCGSALPRSSPETATALAVAVSGSGADSVRRARRRCRAHHVRRWELHARPRSCVSPSPYLHISSHVCAPRLRTAVRNTRIVPARRYVNAKVESKRMLSPRRVRQR
jgi:hypothetical protein